MRRLSTLILACAIVVGFQPNAAQAEVSNKSCSNTSATDTCWYRRNFMCTDGIMVYDHYCTEPLDCHL